MNAEGGDEKQVVVFRVGLEEYALPVEIVQEVLRPLPVTRIPHMPDFIDGIIRLRGQVIPVIDLRIRFGEKAEEHAQRRLIVILLERRRVGMVVDAVLELRRFLSKTMRALPEELPMGGREFLIGVAPAEKGKLLLLVDVRKIFSIQEQEALLAMPSRAS